MFASIAAGGKSRMKNMRGRGGMRGGRRGRGRGRGGRVGGGKMGGDNDDGDGYGDEMEVRCVISSRGFVQFVTKLGWIQVTDRALSILLIAIW